MYASPGSYDRQLDDTERRRLNAELERYEGRVMSDKNAAGVAKVLMEVAEKGCCQGPGGEHRQRERPADGGDRGSQ